MSLETVTLKNGAKEALGIVTTTSIIIEELFNNDFLVAYDLVMVCRDATYKADTVKELTTLALLDSRGRPHSTIKNIVLSGAVGEGIHMKWQRPYDAQGQRAE